MAEEKTVKAMKRIDAANAPILEEELKEVIAKGAECLIIDMEETVYICSVGLRVLLATQKTIRNSGNEMKIIHVLPQIMENFEMTGFSGIMTIE